MSKNENIVFQTPWFEIQTRESRTGGGPHYVVVPPDYVTVVAVTSDNKVVLVRQFRPAAGRETLELPSGLVDTGETPETTAQRELLEETGYQAEKLQYLGSLIPDTGRLGNRLHCYFARVTSFTRERKVDDEGIEVVLYPIGEMKTLISSGDFDHALHCGVWMLAASRGCF